MKKLLRLKTLLFLAILVILIINSGLVFGQNAGISANGATPNASAGLDVNFSNKGLLIPRVALVSTTSSSPLSTHVAGMVLYNTATAGDVTPGLYFNNGTAWVRTVIKEGTASGDMQYWNASTGSWVNLPIGSPGQKLTINASGTPEWTN